MRSESNGKAKEAEKMRKFPKRILFSKFPLIIGLGGGKASEDIKIIFIKKDEKKHFTLRIINYEEEGKLVLDFHSTDETKDKIKNKKEAYVTLMKFIFDSKALKRDTEKLNETFLKLLEKRILSVEGNKIFKGKSIVPLSYDISLLQQKYLGKDLIFDENEEFTKIVNSIHGIEDLDRLNQDIAMIYENDGTIRGVIFKKEGKWNYIDIPTFIKEFLMLLEPYWTIEGIVNKKEFLAEF